jgi:putative transcriptional regulator
MNAFDNPALRRKHGAGVSGAYQSMSSERSSLAPTLLVAMPQLTDPNFSRAVVLLWEHRDDGAMGLIVNRPTETLASQIVQFDPPLERDSDLEVWIGGPVEPTRGWLLLTGQEADGAEICPGIYLSASLDRLRRAMESNESAAQCRFLVGYAGWGPKQLDTELAASAWLTVPLDAGLVFNTPSEGMWEAAIRQLGIDPTALAMGPGVH